MDAFIVYPNALTCLGSGDELWNALVNGACGLSTAHEIYPDWFPDNFSKIGAIPGLNLYGSRLLQILNLLDEHVIPEQAKHCQLIFGASSLGDLVGDFAGDPYGCIQHFFEQQRPELASLFNGVISSACSSGTDVLSLAAMLVSQKKYDIIGVLAADCLDPGKLLQHFALGTQDSDCAKPFDTHRAGTSFGEGGGFAMVVNSNGLKKLPVDHVYKILGFGMSCDAMHVTAPDESGEIPSFAMSRALQAANCCPGDIAYINAHASGTSVNDQVESIALGKVFGEALDNIIVSGTKGAFGHLLGATGLVEAIITCWSLAHSSAPGTVGLSEKDDSLNISVFSGGESTKLTKSIGMSTTFGFGGVNSAIVIEHKVQEF
jgi:3-oxoacyl-[acyl-carrier-protein] synthase II